MAGARQYKAQQFIDAIKGSGGIVSTIAARVGCAWHTAKKYIDTYPTVAKAYADETEGILDLAESTVIRGIKDGDQTSAKWYLTMKGTRRGYVPKQQLQIEVGQIDAAIERELARLAAGSKTESIDEIEDD